MCLRAPLRRAGVEWVRSWYDYKTDRSGCMEHDEIDTGQFWEEVRRVHRVLDQYKPSETYLSGESQGGTVALWAALTYPSRLAGVLAIRTVLLPLLPPTNPMNTPIHVFAARDDEVFPLALQRQSLASCARTWHVHARLTHSQPCAAISTWMRRYWNGC